MKFTSKIQIVTFRIILRYNEVYLTNIFRNGAYYISYHEVLLARLFNTHFYLNVLRTIRIIRIKPTIRNTFSAAKLHSIYMV